MTLEEFTTIYDYQKKVGKRFPTEENKVLMEVLDYINSPGNVDKLKYIDDHDIIWASYGWKNWKEILDEKMKGGDFSENN